MVTLCIEQDVLDRVGPNANAAIIASEAIIQRYIETAERIIVSETRRDWVDDYANVDANVQEELKSATASHAAKQIIMFDPDSIGRSTAVFMANVNQDEFIRTLKTLKDLDTTDIRGVT